MKKSTYLIALAIGVSTITFAQNVGINTDGSDPDANTLLHLNNHSASSLDSALLRIENEKATTGTGVQIENSGTASSKWDIIVPGSSTDLRIKGNGSDHVTIQNDGDVGIGTTTPVSGLDVKTSMGYNINTFDASNPVPSPLNNSHNVILCNDGPYTVNLPAANTCDGRVYYIKNIDTDGDDITIDGNSTETIDGSTTYVLDCENDVVRIISSGSNWFILDRDTGTGTCAAAFTCGTSTVSWTYNGGSVTYGTVLSSTGECWLDRNLGASRVATSSTDTDAYGDLFQWGRGDDGHQVTTSGVVTTLSATDSPGHGNFIQNSTHPRDWRTSHNDNLWQGVSGTNNPCPSGWRLPTEAEFNDELTALSITDGLTAASSILRLPIAGRRSEVSAGVITGTGRYWTSDVAIDDSGNKGRSLVTDNASFISTVRARGSSVRCIKD